MPSGTFEPDTITVKGHTRRPPKRPAPASASSFEPDTQTGGAGGGADFPDYEPQTAFGQPIKGLRAAQAGLGAIGGLAGALVAPEVAGPSILARSGPLFQAAPGILESAIEGVGPAVARAAMSFGGGSVLSGNQKEGAKQAALSLGGDIGAGAVQKIGKGIATGAFNFTPEAAQTAIDEGIPFTAGGVKKALNLIGVLGNRTRAMVAAAGRRGGGLNTRQVADQIESDVLAELSKSSTLPADRAATGKLQALRRQFIDSNPRHLPLETAHTFKQTASKEASPNWLRLENGQKVELPTDPVQRLWKLHEAQRLNEALQNAVGPKYAEINARQARLIKLKDLIAPEAQTGGGIGARISAAAASPIGRNIAQSAAGAGAAAPLPGNHLHNALWGAAISNPALMSMLGLLLANPGTAGLLRQVPRGIESASQ